MGKLQKNDSGFSLVETLLLLVIVGILGFVGWYVYNSNKKANDNLKSSTSTAKFEPKQKAKSLPDVTKTAADPTAEWQSYASTKYGISYKYPTTWAPSGETTLNREGTTLQIFATGLKLTQESKYNNTVNVEVQDESLRAATTYYDNYFAQSSLNQVSKTTSNNVKGYPSTQYKIVNSGVESRMYLFGVNSLTYVFATVNESSNTQSSSDYLLTFDNVYKSLTIKP